MTGALWAPASHTLEVGPERQGEAGRLPRLLGLEQRQGGYAAAESSPRCRHQASFSPTENHARDPGPGQVRSILLGGTQTQPTSPDGGHQGAGSSYVLAVRSWGQSDTAIRSEAAAIQVEGGWKQPYSQPWL